MQIENNILKYYLRDAYFITGTAYAGKSTAVAMLAEEYGLTACGENYHFAMPTAALDPRVQPNACYFDTMSGWEEFLNRTPEQYAAWLRNSAREIADIEIAELIRRSGLGKKLIVDTNIPLDLLRQITDARHVAVMLSPASLSVGRFFDRPDPDKAFLLEKIRACPNPERTMENFKACIALANSPKIYRAYAESGYFTLVRADDGRDTRREVMETLARHFGFERGGDKRDGQGTRNGLPFL